MQQALVRIPIELFEEVMSTRAHIKLQGRDLSSNPTTWEFNTMGVIAFQHDFAKGSLLILVQHPELMKTVSDQAIQELSVKRTV